MIPKEAIDKAIEGGWSGFFARGYTWNGKGITDIDGDFWTYEEVALDPTFWQALGKALGWPEDWYIGESRFKDKVDGRLYRTHCPKWHAHVFFELILAQEDTKTFWEEIIKNGPKQ